MRLLLLAPALLLAACASVPKAPPNRPVPVVPPPLEPSVISMPVTVDLEQLRDDVLRRLPSPVLAGRQTQLLRVRFNPDGRKPGPEPGSCSVAGLDCLTRKATRAVAVDYTAPVETEISHEVFVRDLAMNMTGNLFTLTAQVEFSVSARIKSALTRFGVASCGVRETMPRIEFTLSGYVNWGPAGDIVVTPKPWSMKWLRPCNITAFQINAENLLDLPLLREKLQDGIDGAVFAGLREVSLRALLARSWPLLNEPRELQHGVWLVPHPERVAFADIVGNGRYVTTGVLVRAQPEIVSGTKPAVVVPPVPVPEHGINGDSVHLALKGDIGLEDAERLLTQRLAGKPIAAGGRTIVIDAIRLYGNEDKAVLGLTLSQPVQAEIYVIGKPVFDAEKNEVHFENLGYSLGTRDFLAKTANWLLGSSFRETLQQKARFRFDEDMAESLKEFRDYREDLGQGLVLKGGVTRVRPQALYFTQDRLLAYVVVDGRLALQLGK